MKTNSILSTLFSTLLLMTAGLTLVGCASMGNKIDKEGLSHMKTAAIIGFTVDEREPASLAGIGRGILGMEKADGFGGGKLQFDIQDAKHVDAAYDITAKTLGDKLGMRFLSRDVVAANDGLLPFYEKKNAHFQTGVTPLKPYYDRYEAQNIPQFYYVQWADKLALNDLAKSLGVDTLVIVQSKTDISQSLIVSSIASTANISVMFYDPAKSEFTTYVNQQGDSVNTKDVKFMGFADPDQMHIQSLEAMQTALNQAVSKF